MKRFILPLLMMAFIFPPLAVAEVSVESFQSSLKALYTGDDRALLFTARVNLSEGEAPDHLILFQTNDKAQTFEHRWQMQDNGFMGDKIAGDRIYSRKVEFKESKPGHLYFAVGRKPEMKTSGRLAEVIPENLRASVKIIQRPTFFQLLGKIWNRIKKGSDK